MRLRMFLCSLLLLVGGLGAGASAEAQFDSQETTGQGIPVSVTGEVVEPGLYLRDGQHGTGVTELSYEAASGARTLALLDPVDDTLYLLLTAAPGSDPSQLVDEYLNQMVTVSGFLYERSGIRGIVVTSIEPAK